MKVLPTIATMSRNKSNMFILLILLMSSCATITKKKRYDLQFTSDVPKSRVKVNDSIYQLPARVKVQRSKNDLPIQLISDSLIKGYIIKSSPNPSFIYGNLVWIYAAPVAYIVDFTNQKRFYYGKSIFLNSKDTTGVIMPPLSRRYHNYFSKEFSTNKGQINLCLSIPFVNGCYFQPQGESPMRNVGFWGISGGVEYFYKKNKYIGLTAYAIAGLFVPMGPVDIMGEYEQMSSLFINLSDNYKVKRYYLGYGVNYSINIWELKIGGYGETTNRTPEKKTNQSVGITLNGYFQFGTPFLIGLIYRPTFLNIYPIAEFKYQHVISLDFMWKIRLKR